MQDDVERMVVKRRRPQYFDKRQQLDLVLEARELVEFRDHELSPTESDDKKTRKWMRGALTSGKMQFVWDYCKKVCCLMQ